MISTILRKKRGTGLADLDPRMRLLLVIIFSTTVFMSPNTLLLVWNYVLISLLFFFGGQLKRGIKVSVFFAVMLLLQYATLRISHTLFGETLGLIILLLQRVTVFAIMGMWMTAGMRVSDFIAAMQHMRVPKGIVITLTVVFRYLPTVRQEFGYITNTMKLRDIGISPANMLLRPLKSIEYALVPLVIRSLTVSDELAASAMTRGLDLATQRTSYRDVRLRKSDWLITAAILLFEAAGFVFNALQMQGALI